MKSENCIGILKNRFPFLKRMDVSVTGQLSIKKIMDIFAAGAVVHNLFIDEEHDKIPAEWYHNLDSSHYWLEDDDGGAGYSLNNTKFDRRGPVFRTIIENYY